MDDQNSNSQIMKLYPKTMKVCANKSGWKLFESIMKANISFSLFAASRTKTKKEEKAYKISWLSYMKSISVMKVNVFTWIELSSTVLSSGLSFKMNTLG